MIPAFSGGILELRRARFPFASVDRRSAYRFPCYVGEWMNLATLPLFDMITILMLVLTAGMMWLRLSDNVTSNIPLGYMFVLMLFYRGFEGSFSTWLIFLYLASVVFLRVDLFSGLVQKSLRFFEFSLLAYVMWRLVGLLMGWPPL